MEDKIVQIEEFWKSLITAYLGDYESVCSKKPLPTNSMNF